MAHDRPVSNRREPSPDAVAVPDVVGLRVDHAAAIALAAGMVLAQPDPDGPPLSALTWRRPVVVVTQDPPPRTLIRRYGSVVVTWAEEEAGVREPRRPAPQHTS